ncbi:MAG TPA: alanine--tRNA ligase [Vitreimonas sp.]|nr:alanine--tRNA ligase [Vitreimonas sp.]
MTPNQLRDKYLQYFEKQGHAIVPSSPLVPENDPTTLFTGSGMQPMVPYLLGQPHPKGTRIVDSQKCFRSQDIEEVGDNRHTTFFEMLGNWSLGDYFKKDQLRWFFTFLTDEVGLDPHRIFVTVFRGSEELDIPRDSESVAVWKELFAEKGIAATDIDFADRDGMQDGRIFYYEEKKNWWSRAGVPANMPAGEPGGPDSEVFYDFGAELHLHENSTFKTEPCHVNCDCGRFLEIGNSVFMQYQKQPDGSFNELPQKNVDFGGGLERILAAHNQDGDVFNTELFSPIMTQLSQVSGQEYRTADDKVKRSFRVIADHLKAATMLAADGVYPANKEQGYFARRLVRRAVRYGRMIGITQPFVSQVVQVVGEIYEQAYPEVFGQLEKIKTGLSDEEQKFNKTLEKGLREIEKIGELTGESAFKLYETYGFPLELTEEIAQERGQIVDREAFRLAFNEHKDKSRTASAGKFKGGLQDHSEVTIKYHTATHLLHAALRQVLGTHVQQKGSNITAERLRFDFSHQQAMTEQEKQQVEQLVNNWIKQDLSVTRQTMLKQEALNSGAIAFFLEKYPDEVSVYTVGQDPTGKQGEGWISKEFCGGPHVEHTGQIGPIKLTKEQATSAGVRRVYMELA